MSGTLQKGMDSGKAPENVKRQVFVNGIGICAEPTCSERIMQNRTTLGECAHIIPKVVDSHPREDYTTPLEDRKKENNLLYLCLKHHTLVDDAQHWQIYTVEVLRDWKRKHEEWAAKIKKDAPLPQDFKEMVAEQTNASEAIIGKLLDTCRELLDRHLITEARIFLYQIDLLLLDTNNKRLNAKTDLLNAILSIRCEQIPEAKSQLLQLIKANPDDVEPMLEYVELCDNAPEPDDDKVRIEQRARNLTNSNPRLIFIDLTRKWKKQEAIEIPDIWGKWTDDVRLNAKFICQYALFCDLSEKTQQRDTLINLWQKELPTSPRPHLFKVFFAILDLFRSTGLSLQEQVRALQELLRFSKSEREQAAAKDPLHLRDQISWLMQELKLELAYSDFADTVSDVEELCNKLVSLIEKCYFDSFINDTLLQCLVSLRLEPNQWRAITHQIQGSNVSPTQPIVELIFLRALEYDALYSELNKFIDKYDHSDLQGILQDITNDDAEQASEKVNARKNSMFTLLLLRAINDRASAIRLSELVEVSDDHQLDLRYARLRILERHKRDKEALDIIRNLPLEDAAPSALHIIGNVAYRNKQWDLFVPSATQLLKFDISQSYRSQLHAELAMAYFDRGDDTNAINHADQALSQPDVLGEENSQTLLHVLGESLAMKGMYDNACLKFQQYGQIKRSFPLLIDEAGLYLKSTFPNKYAMSLSFIMRAFEESEVYSDELYASVHLFLIELDNAGIISNTDEPSVDYGLFVKLEGFTNGWFYIGEKDKSLGAIPIRPGSDSYRAVHHKAVGNEIEWPAYKFSNPDARHKILHIVDAPAFLAHRSFEAIDQMAKIGNAPIWFIRVGKEDGTLDIERLNQFFKEQFEPNNELFDSYVRTPMPFASLCTMQGGLVHALGKITSENKGFIRCNNGTQADIDAQRATTSEVLQGKPCFIDGLSALVLAEAGLLEVVIEALPKLGVSTSVIRLLRKIAGDFEFTPSSVGMARFVDGSFQFSPRNKDSDEAVRMHLLGSADLLDKLPNKVIGKNYPKLEDDRNWDHLLPDYFVDAFRYAQEQEAHLLSDDWLFVEYYKVLGESPVPKHLSSISLIRAMADSKRIAWDVYLKYFALLSFYRYHLLLVSVDDMFQAVFPPTSGGLAISVPQNLSLLNLQFTLSPEYGVDDKTVIGILSSFFTRLILDESVLPKKADEIFALAIVQSLAKRDRRMMSRVIIQVCQQQIGQRLSPNIKSKLQILDKQLFGYSQGSILL